MYQQARDEADPMMGGRMAPPDGRGVMETVCPRLILVCQNAPYSPAPPPHAFARNSAQTANCAAKRCALIARPPPPSAKRSAPIAPLTSLRHPNDTPMTPVRHPYEAPMTPLSTLMTPLLHPHDTPLTPP